MDLNKIAIKGSTQDHLPINDIKNDLVILNDGSCVMILKTSSVNFDLLSEKEQEAIIYAYAALLNSLTFPIQILIRSASKDVSNYINRLEKQEGKVIEPLLKKQIQSYRRFVSEVVKTNNVLAKSFYFIIPFFAIELGLQTTAKKSFNINNLFTKKENTKLPLPKDDIIKKALASLAPKKDHLTRLLARIGLSIKYLETKEIIRLFYQIYNQDSVIADNTEALNQRSVIIKGKMI